MSNSGDLHMDLTEVKNENDIMEYENDIMEYENDIKEYENDIMEYENDIMEYKNDIMEYEDVGLWDIDESTSNEDNIHKCSSNQEMKPLSQILKEELHNEKEDIHERNVSFFPSEPDIIHWWMAPISLSLIIKNEDLSVDKEQNTFYLLPNNLIVFNNNNDANQLVENQSISSNLSVDDINDDATPKGLLVCLTPNQKRDILWLKSRETEKTHGGIIIDGNSTGKTFIMIVFILKSVEEISNGMQGNKDNVMNGGTLVVCPLLLLNQWFNEIKTNVTNGSLKVFKYCHRDGDAQASKLEKFDLVFTTYESIKWDYKNKKKSSSLFKIKWMRIILDEASNLQKRNSLACKSLCNLSSVYRFAIADTQIPNEDFFSLVKFIRCEPFDDWIYWKKFINPKCINKLSSYIIPPVLKSSVLRNPNEELPTNMVYEIEVQLSKDERDVYEQLLQFSINLNYAKETKDKNFQVDDFLKLQDDSKVIPVLTKLFNTFNNKCIQFTHLIMLNVRIRQFCCHAYLLKEKVSKENKIKKNQQDNSEDSHLVNTPLVDRQNIFKKSYPSSKVRAICDKVKEIMLASNSMDKIVIISNWCSMLNIIKQNLSSQYLTEVFSPDVKKSIRTNMIENFNNFVVSHQILLTTQNYVIDYCDVYLSAANHVFFVDSLNTVSETNICYRIYRTLPIRPINVYKFLCLNTIETEKQELQADELEFNIAQLF